MSKSKKKQPKTEAGTPALAAAMMAVNPVATKAWMDIMSESVDFVMNRLQSDFDTQKAILACKSPEELMQVQSDFIRGTMEQYSDETARLLKMMSRATEDTIDDAKSGHKRGYDNIPV